MEKSSWFRISSEAMPRFRLSHRTFHWTFYRVGSIGRRSSPSQAVTAMRPGSRWSTCLLWTRPSHGRTWRVFIEFKKNLTAMGYEQPKNCLRLQIFLERIWFFAFIKNLEMILIGSWVSLCDRVIFSHNPLGV